MTGMSIEKWFTRKTTHGVSRVVHAVYSTEYFIDEGDTQSSKCEAESTAKNNPIKGKVYICVLKNYRKDKDIYQVHRLKAVFKDDCAWVTADDGSEINYDWNVVHWQEELT